MPDDRSFHVLEAVPNRLEASPQRARRRWSAEAKARLIEESLKPGANVSAIAREAGLATSQLFGWRRQVIKSGAVTPQQEAARLGFVVVTPAAVVEIDRSQMAQWMGKLGFELEPLADHILARIKQGERVFADETTLPTLAPGSGKAKTAYLWTYVRDDRPFGGSGPPIVAYRFEDSRAGECVARHLEGYCGILQVDGYAAYNQLAKPDRANDGVTLAGCWSHVRRKFYEPHIAGSSVIASQTVEQMAPLWAIEETVRGHDPAARVTARQEKSAAVIAALFALWEKELPKLSGKSKPAEAIRYALGRRAVLERFLGDGRIELDSNTVERAIRPQTITRKNSLFAGSDGGGRTWATIATLLATAKMSQVDPHAWLTQTLQRIANGWPNSDIDALMPWNYQS